MMRFRMNNGDLLEFTMVDAHPILDDDMIKRGAEALAENDGEWTTSEEQARIVLEAALEVKAKYPISKVMLEAGNSAWNKAAGIPDSRCPLSALSAKVLRAAYTAMREAEEKK